MPVRAAINHVTDYHYDRPVSLGPQVIRLRPAPHCRTPVPSYALKITPANHFINWQQDPHGNWLARLVFPEKTEQFRIEVDLTADMAVINPFDFFVEPSAETFPFTYDDETRAEVAAYLEPEVAGPKLKAFLATIPREPKRSIDVLIDINTRLSREIAYVIRMEPGVQEPEQTLTLKSGSCRDSAWLMVQILRNIGLAARFVSGYLIQLKADIDPVSGPLGTRGTISRIFTPGPKSTCRAPVGSASTRPPACSAARATCPWPRHRITARPHPSAAHSTPARSSSITRWKCRASRKRRASPRPSRTKPGRRSTPSGGSVDAELRAADVRLTTGGEPTFVSIDDFEAPEWNSEAVGPTKRGLGDSLIRRLRTRFAPGGFLHYGQGKWYPGESLPRWAFSLYWRKDGKPIWQDADLIASETGPRSAKIEDARRLMQAIAHRLGLEHEYVQGAYEDPAHWILKEASLPREIDALQSPVGSVEQRARIARVFSRGLTVPAGFVLPITRWGRDWSSERWQTRREHLFLVPGDSPLGFRLPLETLDYIPPSRFPYCGPAGPDRASRSPARSRPAHHHHGITRRAPVAAAGPRSSPQRSRSPHGLRGRAPRRHALRLHAAGRPARRLPRTSRPPSKGRRATSACRSISKATARPTIRGST